MAAGLRLGAGKGLEFRVNATVAAEAAARAPARTRGNLGWADGVLPALCL